MSSVVLFKGDTIVFDSLGDERSHNLFQLPVLHPAAHPPAPTLIVNIAMSVMVSTTTTMAGPVILLGEGE